MAAIHGPIMPNRIMIAWYGQYITWYTTVQFSFRKYKYRYIQCFTYICQGLNTTLCSNRVDIIVHYCEFIMWYR